MKSFVAVLTTLFLLIATAAQAAGPSVWGAGSFENILAGSGIKFRDLTQLMSGSLDPTSSAVNAPKGSIYLSSSTGHLYVKQDAGLTTNWLDSLTSSSGWALGGNAGTTAGTNFLGTSDSVDLVLKTNGSERFRITSAGTLKTQLSTGLIHSDGSGNLSSSLLVNADINAAAAIDFSKMAALTASRALETSAGGVIQASATTAADLAALSARSPLNTASAIVSRDGSGDFAAHIITAALAGNASTASALAANPTDCAANRFANTIDAGGNLTCSQVLLSAAVTGTLPIGNGGTGQTTATAAFDALSPMTTLGDLIYGGASGTGTRLAGNTTSTKKFLRQTGNGSVSAAPAWDTLVSGDIPSLDFSKITTGTVPINQGGTGQTTNTAAFDALAPVSPAKGTVLVYSGSHWVNLGVGSNGQAIVADSTASNGIKWGAPSGTGGVDYGYAYMFSAGCVWTKNAGGTFADMNTTSACAGPTVVTQPASGTIQTTDADLPQFTINSLVDGTYKVEFDFQGGNTSSGSRTNFRISDGTNTSLAFGGQGLNGIYPSFHLTGYFTYSGGPQNVTWKIQVQNGAGVVTIDAQSDGVSSPIAFTITRIQ